MAVNGFRSMRLHAVDAGAPINYTKGKISLMSLEIDLYAVFLLCAMTFDSKTVLVDALC